MSIFHHLLKVPYLLKIVVTISLLLVVSTFAEIIL